MHGQSCQEFWVSLILILWHMGWLPLQVISLHTLLEADLVEDAYIIHAFGHTHNLRLKLIWIQSLLISRIKSLLGTRNCMLHFRSRVWEVQHGENSSSFICHMLIFDPFRNIFIYLSSQATAHHLLLKILHIQATPILRQLWVSKTIKNCNFHNWDV